MSGLSNPDPGKEHYPSKRNPNPMEIDLILQLLFTFLPVNDLRFCRLVNRQWQCLATTQLQKDLKPVRFHQVLPNLRRYLRFHRITDVSNFTEVATKTSGPIPWLKFDIGSALIRQQVEDEPILYQFFTCISSWVNQLTLHHDTVPLETRFFTRNPRYLEFPSLSKVKFRAEDNCNLSRTMEANLQLLLLIMQRAPNLKSVGLRSHQDPRIITLFLACLKSANPPNLDTLQLGGVLEDKHLDNLTTMKVSLKKLTLFIRRIPKVTKLRQFLETQTSCLEKLSISSVDSFSNTQRPLQIPPMAVLETLSIQQQRLTFSSTNYAAQFPKLKKITFLGTRHTLGAFMGANRNPVQWTLVQKLELPIDMGVDLIHIHLVNNMFPSIRFLTIPLRFSTVLTALQLMSQLKELTLQAPENTNPWTLSKTTYRDEMEEPLVADDGLLDKRLRLVTFLSEEFIGNVSHHRDVRYGQVLEMVKVNLNAFLKRTQDADEILFNI